MRIILLSFILTFLVVVGVIFLVSPRLEERQGNKVASQVETQVETHNGIFTQREEIYEFQYKNHTYIYTKVSAGISTTHQSIKKQTK